MKPEKSIVQHLQQNKLGAGMLLIISLFLLGFGLFFSLTSLQNSVNVFFLVSSGILSIAGSFLFGFSIGMLYTGKYILSNTQK